MKRFLIYLLCACSLASCDKDEYLGTTIEQPTVEFAQTKYAETISFIASDEYNIAVPIQVFGGNSTGSINISAQTALPNDAYSVSTSKTLNGNALDTIYITINTAKITKGEAYSINVTISSSEISVSKNYATCSVTFSQQAFIDYFTGTYSCFESSTNSTYDVELTKQNDTTIKNNNFWDFPLAGQYVPFIFSQDETMAVTIPNDTQWTDLLGNKYLISGMGKYDFQGNFYVDFTMKTAATNEVYQSGRQTYTKK